MNNFRINIILYLLLLPILLFYTYKTAAAKSAAYESKTGALYNYNHKELDKILKLKLKIFLGANDLKNADNICKEAMGQFPADYRWLERCGQVLIWMGNMNKGVNDYYKAFILSGNKAMAEKVYKFFISYHRWNMAEKMLDTGMVSASLKDKVYIYTMAGSAKKLLKFLKKLYTVKKSNKVLNYLIYTYWEIGNVKKTIKTIKLLKKRFGLDPGLVVLYSDVLAVKMNYKKAFNILKNFASKAPPRDYIFWDKLSDLGWMLGHYKTAVRASMHLADLKTVKILETKEDANGRFYKKTVSFTPGRRRDYERIYLYYSDIYPEIAMKYALLGWNKYHIDNLFEGLIYLASKEKMHRYVIKRIKGLSENDFAELSKNVYFVLNYSNALVKTGHIRKAEKICILQLNKKFNPDFLSELIYMELNTNNTKMLKYISSRWGRYPFVYPSLVTPFISLYMYFENSREALSLSKYLNENPTVGNRLIYADILSLHGNVHAARGIRYNIWIKMKGRLKNNPELKNNVSFMENFLSVSMRLDNRKKFIRTLQRSKKILPPKTFADFMLSYELFRNYRNKTLYLRYKLAYELKPWMKLDLALWNRDTYMQYELLKKFPDILPIRYRVEALSESGDIGGAFNYAFKGLEENSKDYLLYRQFRDLADKYSDRAKISTQYINWQGYREISENMYLKYRLANGFSLTPSIKIGKEISYDEGEIINAPYKHYNTALTLEKQYANCGFKTSAGAISSIGTNPYFIIEPKCKITDSTSLKLFYGEHIEDDDTLFLYLGGLKREFEATVYNSVTRRISFTAYVSQDWYMSQDNISLGSGNGIYGELDYKLTGTYPDITLRSFARSNKYYDGGNYGDILNLSPFSHFDALPSSYSLIGEGFTVGSNYKYKLEKTWRPFLYSDIFYETDSGIGYDAGGGYGGSLLGNDNLSLGMNYFSNFQGSSASYLEFFINYNIYF